MDWLTDAFGLLVHLDQHLVTFSRDYGAWIYGLLFLIIFCERGWWSPPSCLVIPCCLSPGRSQQASEP